MNRFLLLFVFLFPAFGVHSQSLGMVSDLYLGGGLVFEDSPQFSGAWAQDMKADLNVYGTWSGFRGGLGVGIHYQGESRIGAVVYRGYWGPQARIVLGWDFPLDESHEWLLGPEVSSALGYERYHYLYYEFLQFSFAVRGVLSWNWADSPGGLRLRVGGNFRVDNQLDFNAGPDISVGFSWRIF